jgi:hypothetical protein
MISHEIAENTNKPLIKELKDYKLVGTSAALSCQRPVRFKPGHRFGVSM